MKLIDKIALGEELSDLWMELEEEMSDHGAYEIACEQLGVDPDEGYDYIRLFSSQKAG